MPEMMEHFQQQNADAVPAANPEFHAFSRVFEFLVDPFRAADLLRSCGYDGVEWTARPGGFINPNGDVAAGLRRAKAAAAAAGLKADNLVVWFLDGGEPGAERLVMEAAEAGFRSFRGAYFRYDRAKTHQENFDAFRRGFDSLAALAEKSGMKCCYQNHSTYNKASPLFGSLVWDLAEIVRDYDPALVGIQYDPMHIRAEGGPSWDHTLGAVAKWIDIVNSENPDLVLIAGDIVDMSYRPVIEEDMAAEFRRMKAPVYACLGNHEYYSGEPNAELFYREAGINLLIDSVADFNGISIIGRDDRTNPNRLTLKQLQEKYPALNSQFSILLDHQPYHLEEAEQCGIDFQLSGHTHRGQVWPISWITDAIYECSWGSHQRGKTSYYVSSGLGIWGAKFRIGSQSEYIVVNLK